jgi:acyl-CoA dehydrogenase
MPGDVDDDFASAVHDFLDAKLTPDLREAGRQTTGVHSDIAACRIWHDRLFKQGWIAPAWPPEFGGTGWTIAQRLFFDRECAKADAPILFATGLRSIGPLIMAMGTAEQKDHYLAPILRGDHLWCQGFSESGAGSDLAALTTRAKRSSTTYIVNGRKLWTTGAHISTHMFALVRTGTFARRQEGITFLLIDMKTPGISVHPIVTIDGQHEFNEVTFDDVAVPVANRIGAEHEGWLVAKHLMRMARSNNTNSGLLHRAWRAVERQITHQTGALDGTYLMRKAEIDIQLAALESLEHRLLNDGRLSGDDEDASSLMKITATELHQRIAQLLFDLCGPDVAQNTRSLGGFATQKYFATRAASIYSGTNEIHRNVIGSRIASSLANRP